MGINYELEMFPLYAAEVRRTDSGTGEALISEGKGAPGGVSICTSLHTRQLQTHEARAEQACPPPPGLESNLPDRPGTEPARPCGGGAAHAANRPQIRPDLCVPSERPFVPDSNGAAAAQPRSSPARPALGTVSQFVLVTDLVPVI